ncbi:hypothetical protein M569_10881, partial [Genlisea aurea]
QDKFVLDSSLDYRGRIPLRISTGSWRASLFIVVIEFGERLSYFGISTTLIIYLTTVLQQDVKTAARSVNYWAGVTTLMPLAGGFAADAYLGCFNTVLASTVLYVSGLLLLTLSRAVPGLKPSGSSDRVHEIVFFLAMYMVSVATGGHKPALQSFGADQFEDDHPGERKQKMSFFNWWNFALCCGCLLGVTVIVYVQDHVGWISADIVLTSVMASSVLVFVAGRRFYRYRRPVGSPLTPLFQVICAAFRKRGRDYPTEPESLYEVPAKHGRLLCHTPKFRFLDKAAILEGEEEEEKENPWLLATVTRVEELKLIINMIPIWLTALPFGICISQTSTFFIKQSTIMDRRIGHAFVVPPASIYALSAVGMIATVVFFDRVLVPVLRRSTGDGERGGIGILRRIGIGMAFSAASMAVAAAVERRRLRFSAAGGGDGGGSVLWLAPQFVIMGIGDGFALVGLQEYFYDQVPDSMRGLGIALYLSVIGAGNFLSGVLIGVVDRVTRKTGKSWFGFDLNSSRIDRFYWLLAVL